MRNFEGEKHADNVLQAKTCVQFQVPSWWPWWRRCDLCSHHPGSDFQLQRKRLLDSISLIGKLVLTKNISGSTFLNPLNHTSFSSLGHHLGIFPSHSGCCISFGCRYGNNLLHLHRTVHVFFLKLSWTASLLLTAATLCMLEEVHGLGGYDDDIVRANFRWNLSLFCP